MPIIKCAVKIVPIFVSNSIWKIGINFICHALIILNFRKSTRVSGIVIDSYDQSFRNSIFSKNCLVLNPSYQRLRLICQFGSKNDKILKLKKHWKLVEKIAFSFLYFINIFSKVCFMIFWKNLNSTASIIKENWISKTKNKNGRMRVLSLSIL